MSAALHYLERLRKNQLAELAEATALRDYEDDNKPELAAKLDEHLQANRTIFGADDRLTEYYRRLSQGSRASPVKRESRESRSEASPVKEDAPRSVRRRTTKPREPKESKEDREPTDESDVPAQTPTRALAEVAIQLPPSPSVVTEVIDRQTTQWRKSISEAWKNSGVQERSDSLRTTLSSVRSVEVIVTILEAFGILAEVLPRRHLTAIPPIDALRSPALPIKIPDVFVLVDSSFWAPVSLWLLTSLLLPLTIAYFFNISLQVAQSSGGPASRTRRSSITRNPQADFDPLSFNIAKALISYLVYAHGFTFWNIYSKASVETVNASIPFQYAGILTGAAIGAIGTFYEAILRK